MPNTTPDTMPYIVPTLLPSQAKIIMAGRVLIILTIFAVASLLIYQVGRRA